MALDVYFCEDVARVLCAPSVAGEGTLGIAEWASTKADLQQDTDRARELLDAYQAGYCTALKAVGLAFGLPPMPTVQRLLTR